MNTAQLVKLREATDDAIGVVGSGPHPRGAVNWADLHCLQAAWVVTDDGEPYAEVTIEKAAPDNFEFQEAIEKELVKSGWLNVLVMTEW